MRQALVRPFLPSLAAALLAACGATGSPPPTSATPTTELAKATCTKPPVVSAHTLFLEVTATRNATDWAVQLTVAPFHGAQTYRADVARTTSLVVYLSPTATPQDEDRVLTKLRSAPGVTMAEMASSRGQSNAPQLIEVRVSVASADEIDGVLPTIRGDASVNGLATALVFGSASEKSAPVTATARSGPQSAALHSISGEATTGADGGTGRFGIVFSNPYDHSTVRLAASWSCPAPPPSIGAAGTNLGTPAVVVTTNDQASGFLPANVTVKVGQIVEWKNPGTLVHNISFANDPGVSSGTLSGGSTWQVRFTRSGSYKYTCTFHQGEEGTVTVTP
jgi:plastocyanin